MRRQSAPLVTVIVPVYNVEKYLVRCLDSIASQTYRNLEIIVVNDGSTDASGEICRQYVEHDPRMLLLFQENQGSAVARNLGLNHASGEYVVFVDSDDYISECFVEALLNQAIKYDAPIVVCDYMCVEDAEDHARIDTAADGAGELCRKMRRNDVFDTMLTDREFAFVSPCWKLYHKDIFRELRYPPGKFHEDAYIFHEIYAQVDELCYVNLKLYAYRQSRNSKMRKNGVTETHPDLIGAHWERFLFFCEYGVSRYYCTAGKELLNTFAGGANISDKARLQTIRKALEAKVYAMTGKRCYTAKYVLFKLSPRLHRIVRKIYWKLTES